MMLLGVSAQMAVGIHEAYEKTTLTCSSHSQLFPHIFSTHPYLYPASLYLSCSRFHTLPTHFSRTWPPSLPLAPPLSLAPFTSTFASSPNYASVLDFGEFMRQSVSLFIHWYLSHHQHLPPSLCHLLPLTHLFSHPLLLPSVPFPHPPSPIVPAARSHSS